MVLFQNGRHGIKQYPEVLPGENISLRQGKYIMSFDKDKVFIKDPLDDRVLIIELFAVSSEALLNLHVDLERDVSIPLTLDRRGNFNRTDGFPGSVNIRKFFSQNCEGGVFYNGTGLEM